MATDGLDHTPRVIHAPREDAATNNLIVWTYPDNANGNAHYAFAWNHSNTIDCYFVVDGTHPCRHNDDPLTSGRNWMYLTTILAYGRDGEYATYPEVRGLAWQFIRERIALGVNPIPDTAKEPSPT